MADFTTCGVRAALRQWFAVCITAGLPALLAAGGTGAREQDAMRRLRYGPGVTNHPVGVVPSEAVRIPADWPLSADGGISCLTCHRELPALDGTTRPVLRGAGDAGGSGVDFCASCHAASADRSAAGAHWMAVRVAHVQAEARSSASDAGWLDAESRRCLSCHDGINAGESTNPTASSMRTFSDLRRNHPVGVTYGGQRAGPGGTPLRSAHRLPARVRLPEGKVSCVSCHDLYETGPHRLSVSMEESQLCRTCHDQK
jgi:predicted CXXCH cytochrome family protein